MKKFKSKYVTEKKWVVVNPERAKIDKLELEFAGWKAAKSVLESGSVMFTCERTRK